MLGNFFKGFFITLAVIFLISVFWWLIKLAVDMLMATFGFLVGLLTPWFVVLIICIIAGIIYMNRKKNEI